MAERWGGLRPDPYDPDARDADADGIVQEGTAWERPAGTRLLLEGGEELGRGATAAARPAGVRIVDRDGKDVDYSPTWLRAGGAARVEVQQSPLADHGARSLRERGLPSLRQIIQTDQTIRSQTAALESERALVERRNNFAPFPISAEDTPAMRIARRNLEVKQAVEAAGGSLFDMSDPEVVAGLRGGLAEKFPDSPFLRQIKTSREHYLELRQKIIDEMADVRKKAMNGEFPEMHPDVREMIVTKTDEELFEIIKEQAAKFHQTRDKTIRVQMLPNRLDLLLSDSDGRYRTTHTAVSDASGADPRRQYEAAIGIPVSADAELRPASGYVLHPDWMKAMDAAFEKEYGRPPTEFDARGTEMGAGNVAQYGAITLKLRPEVSGRTAVGVDDSLNTGLQPVFVDEQDPELILKSVLSEGHTVTDTNRGLALGLLKSWATGSFADFGTNAQYSKDSFEYRDVRTFLDPSRRYNEALIAGSFDLTEVEEVVAPLELLGDGYHHRDTRFVQLADQGAYQVDEEKVRAFNAELYAQYFSPEALREFGLSDEEIQNFYGQWYLDAGSRDVEIGLSRANEYILLPPGLKSAIAELLSFDDAMRRKAKLEESGIRVVVTNSRRDLGGVDMFAPKGGKTAADVQRAIRERRLKNVVGAIRRYASIYADRNAPVDESFG